MNNAEIKNIYLGPVKREISRLISMEDRERFSSTYGCFDRTHWGWKFTDFPGARYQEAVCALAFLYKQPFWGDSFKGNEKILNWAKAGFEYWRNLQYPDGSFDEAYPGERSLAAVGFTCFYLGEAFLMLSEDLSESEKKSLGNTFSQAGIWLCRNDELHGTLSNHLAAAAAALYIIYKITGDSRFEQRLKYFLNRIYSCQSREGWYEEYGGADIGYQTHTTFYLARLWQYTRDEVLLESLKKSIHFLKHFIHPNETIGGEYGSRNTEFYMPAGFEILATTCADAAIIAKNMRQSVKEQTGVGLASMDAQNFMPLFNNYLFAAEYSEDLESANGQLPFQQGGEWEFADAGLIVISNPNYHAILAPSKGGVIKIYDCKKKKLHLSDCGYWATFGNGKVSSNQVLNRTGHINREGNTFVIKTVFQEINQKTLTPISMVFFRLFSLSFGSVKAVSYWLKNLLVKTLVKGSRPVPIQITRKVNFMEKEIVLIDQIKLDANVDLRMLKAEGKFAAGHMGSSRYFCEQEMDPKSLEDDNLSEELKKNRNITIERIFKFE